MMVDDVCPNPNPKSRRNGGFRRHEVRAAAAPTSDPNVQRNLNGSFDSGKSKSKTSKKAQTELRQEYDDIVDITKNYQSVSTEDLLIYLQRRSSKYVNWTESDLKELLDRYN